jgi:hypothetical protein
MRRFIALSPFSALATHDTDDASDVSPRGDALGWVYMTDNKTLILPERPGNKRLDSVFNVINQPKLSPVYDVGRTGNGENQWHSECLHGSEFAVAFAREWQTAGALYRGHRHRSPGTLLQSLSSLKTVGRR